VPPTVSATVSGSSGTITLTASASDNRGVIRVDYFIDGAPLGASSTGPNYTLTTDSTNLVNGSHVLLAQVVDAAGNVGTSSPFTFNTNNITSEYLINPSFEGSAAVPDPWIATPQVFSAGDSTGAHDGSNWLWLCGFGSAHLDSAYQAVTLPPNLSAVSLSFWLKITSEDVSATVHDIFKVQVRDTNGLPLGTLATYSNLDSSGVPSPFSHAGTYVQRIYDLLPYKGRSIQIYVEGSEDASLITNFEVDDFHLRGTLSNLGPVVTITTPTNGVQLASGAATPFTATASDTDGVNAATLTWTWGDGTLASTGTFNAMHAFVNTGNTNLIRTVTFTASDNLGVSSNTAISVTVHPKLDLNQDGVVDLQELLTFAKHYGTTNATCDLNGDGTVDEIDLGLLLAGL
jgi:hypothetical protein